MNDTSAPAIRRRQILRMPEVMQRTGLSRSTIYNYVATGMFPRQVPLGARAIGWFEDEIERWLEQRGVSRGQVA